MEDLPEENSNIDLSSKRVSSPKLLRLRDYHRPEPDGTEITQEEACRRLGLRVQSLYKLKRLHPDRIHSITLKGGRRRIYFSYEIEALAADLALLRAENHTAFEFRRLVETAA